MNDDHSHASHHVSKEAPLKGIHVLVVDDSKINLMVAEKLLLHGGAIVTVDSDGSTAVEWLKQNPTKIDLVLLDVNMPIMDGLTAVKLIREDPNLRHLPVIAMTAADSDEEKSHAIACGMTDHIIKPFNFNSLVAVLIQHLPKLSGAAKTFEDRLEARAHKDWPMIEGIDKSQAINSYLGDKDSFLRQLRRLLSEFQFAESPLRVPAQPQAWYELAMQMHKLVGNAGLLGAQTLSVAAKRAEISAKKCDASEVLPALEQVASQLKRLRLASAQVLTLSRSDSTEVADTGQSLNFTAIQAWVVDLQGQKFSAIRQFALLKNELIKIFTSEDLMKIEEALDDLEFDRVLEIVQPRMNSINTIVGSLQSTVTVS